MKYIEESYHYFVGIGHDDKFNSDIIVVEESEIANYPNYMFEDIGWYETYADACEYAYNSYE